MYLFSICVDPSQHGGGIAAPLLDEFKRCAAADGSERVELTVVDDNERAIRFYEREGWTRSKHLGTTFEYVIDL
jgi:ribosomal protein S18 acetylase RimI-like enzyme